MFDAVRVDVAFERLWTRVNINSLTTTVAISVSLPDRVKPSFVIFDIRALWRSGLSVSARMSKITNENCQKNWKPVKAVLLRSWGWFYDLCVFVSTLYLCVLCLLCVSLSWSVSHIWTCSWNKLLIDWRYGQQFADDVFLAHPILSDSHHTTSTSERRSGQRPHVKRRRQSVRVEYLIKNASCSFVAVSCRIFHLALIAFTGIRLVSRPKCCRLLPAPLTWSHYKLLACRSATGDVCSEDGEHMSPRRPSLSTYIIASSPISSMRLADTCSVFHVNWKLLISRSQELKRKLKIVKNEKSNWENQKLFQ